MNLSHTLLLCTFTVVVLSGTDVADALSINATCGRTVSTYCDKESGLVCGPDLKCVCSSGDPNRGGNYVLAWNAAQNKCLAQPGSPCVGTASHPAPDGASFAACVPNYACVPEPSAGLPPGLGVCKSETKYITYESVCSRDSFCDKAAGLICNADFKCGCSTGVVSEELEYRLRWNEDVGKCLGDKGSACHQEFGVAECGPGLTCNQIEKAVPGIGICSGAAASTIIGFSYSIVLLMSAVLTLFFQY